MEEIDLVYINIYKQNTIRSDMTNFNELEEKGWLLLAERDMGKVWDNPQDDQVWSKYTEN